MKVPALWRERRWVKVAAIVAALAVLWLGGPLLLRHVSFFRVRQIELVGVRYMAPGAVIGALALSKRASVFDATEPLTARLRALPGIADARLVRRFPGALKVIVREVEPVALVPGATGGPLTVVDSGGRALPYDPSRVGLDLPVAASVDSGLVAVLALVQSVDPTMFETISSVRPTRGGTGVVLQMGSKRVLVARDAGPDVIRAVERVTEDLATRERSYTELDARYAGQVIVRKTTGNGGA
ncbi:MAG TPA: FtsQ-type POTRA domain-containing protein [Gemmatimonadales bacterium]|nr:FtsQ-type POTRA domain-containing protein [Gemmatimonadales bacterium]